MAYLRRISTILSSALVVLLVAATTAFADTRYVSLGDSYASGVGTRTYNDDGSGCGRSPLAHPRLYADRIGADFHFAACSGANTADLRNGQLGDLDAETDLVTVTIGGNDIGWSDVITACALPWPFTCWKDIERAEAHITGVLPGRLAQTYDAIRDAAPDAEVYVLGYPRLFNERQPCNVITRISPEEQRRMNRAADLLSDVIETVATSRGFTYVDVRDAFQGHAVCDRPEWINGLSWPIQESYHPNVQGQNGYLDELIKAAG
jgi:lysophospholipase L1-like esterase